MPSNKILTAQILNVTARELNDDCFCFPVYEFENGLIMVVGETTNDWFFEDRGDIEPCGCAVVESVEETGETREFTAKSLLESIQGSIKEFGVDAVPSSHFELWKNAQKN